MLVYIDNKGAKKELVVAEIICDIFELNNKIDSFSTRESFPYIFDAVDKLYVIRYLDGGKVDNYCDPSDILSKDVDLKKITQIFATIDYNKFRSQLYCNCQRLLILYDVIGLIEINELNRYVYDENTVREHFQQLSDYSFVKTDDELIKSIEMNTLILKLINQRRQDPRFNFDEENIANILNRENGFDANCVRPIPCNCGAGAQVKLKRANAELGAQIIID